MMAEFARDLPVFCTNPNGERVETSLAALLPDAFRLGNARRGD